MRARAVLLRALAVCLGVPVGVAMLYALVVPAFLGAEESAREVFFRATVLATACLLAAMGALPLRYLGALYRATRALRASPPRGLVEADAARVHAAPREGAAVLALSALAVLLVALRLGLRGDPARAVAAVVGAALLMTASLVFYPAMRSALRPLFDALAPSSDASAAALGDRLTTRVVLAVAVPAGVAALLASLLVAAHVSSTAHDQAELDAKVLTLAIGVRRMPGESPDGRADAARFLASMGERVTAGVELPLVEAPPLELSSPARALAVAVAFALLGGALGWSIGRRAVRELAQSKRRVETVGLQHLAAGGRLQSDGASMTFSVGVLSLPEVRAIAQALDRVTEALAAMAGDQRKAVTARAEAARLRSFVLAGVSHDLRGPLNALLGFAGLLLQGVDGELTAGQRESLEALTRGGRDLLRMVDDLLDAARLDAGRMTLTRRRVLVADLVADARKAALERTAGAVTEDLPLPADGDLELDAAVDRERVGHYLGALLAYALLRTGAAPAGGAVAPATMRVRAVDDKRWTLTITGHGSTLAPEAMRQLLDPFDLPPSGARAPAGLGLALGVARRVMELNNGSVRAEAAPDGGLALVVTLPRSRPRALSPGPSRKER